MNRIINIAIAEDYGALTQGYKELFSRYKNFKILFSAIDGAELLGKLNTNKPDILILDLVMPGISGNDLLKILNEKYPKIAIVIVSGHFDQRNVIEAFKLGVRAFLPKIHNIEKIVEVINCVFEKGKYIDEEVAFMLADEVGKYKEQEKASFDLTPQQLQVLKMLCSGYTNPATAKALNLSLGTVKYHRENIMERTNSKTFKDLMRFAIQHKIIDPI